MTLRGAVPAALLAVAVSTSAPAVPVNIDAEIERAGALADGGDAPRALKRLDELRRRTADGRDRVKIDLIRAVILVSGNRGDEALAALRSAENDLPGDPAPLLAMFALGNQFQSLDILAPALDRLVAGYPDVARGLEPEKVFPILRGLRANQRGDEADAMTVRLAEIGFGGDRYEVRDDLAVSAIDELLSAGRIDDARRLSSGILDRGNLVRLLTNRQYQSLWPALETRVGPRMEQPLEEAVIVAERLARERTDDLAARATLLHAYYAADRSADADRVGAAFAANPEAMKQIDEQGGWLVNEHARVLYDLKREAAGDARFAAMRAIDIAKAPWLISMVINRIEWLVNRERYAAALPLLDEAQPLGERYGSPYARQLLRRLRVCAVAKTRPADPALPKLIDDMIAHADDAKGPTVEGLMCAGRADEAARRAVVLLADESARQGMIDSLRPVDQTSSLDASSWAGSLAPLYSRAEVKAAFDANARELPERFRRLPVKAN